MVDALLRGFSPVRFRTLFMLGAAWMTIAALAAAGYAIHGIAVGSALQIGFNGVLSVVLLLAVRGLLRMRAWGLVLGGFISLALLATAPFYGSVNAITLTLAAIPALLFWVAPVLFAQRSPAVRVVSNYRVELETLSEDLVDEAEEDSIPLEGMSPRPSLLGRRS